MLEHREKVAGILKDYHTLIKNPTRKKLILDSVKRKYAMVLPTGTLATWTPVESSGRSPKDTYMVKRKESESAIDWSSPNSISLDPDTFEILFRDSLSALQNKRTIYVLNRVVGADSSYALPVTSITDSPLHSLFVDNMFRAIPEDIEKSIFYDRPFILIVLPYDKIVSQKYNGRLRQLPEGKTSDMAVAADFDKRIGIVYGSAYMGSIKKLIFTVMNFYLPAHNILPLHCSANEGNDGSSALLLGLSGTGKTTLSADPQRALLGDDEHGWSDEGIANFENGCYAKLINLDPEKEPEIYKATFHSDYYLNHGTIVENLMVYVDGTFDLDDSRFTPNSRASYPLRYLSNIKESSVSGHPKSILFLTADAYGVLPPISKLTPEQAMFWFMMGYTSKLAGTETGIVEPQTTFSRFFGEPFMPRLPSEYANLLGEKMKKFGVTVYLVNTGWSGGPYGVGERMDINLTRSMVRGALDGKLKNVEYEQDPIFKVWVPQSCPGIPSKILKPVNTWADKGKFKEDAMKLATKFARKFDDSFAGKVSESIAAECPGK